VCEGVNSSEKRRSRQCEVLLYVSDFATNVRYEITPSDHLEALKVRFGFSARLGKILIGIAGIGLGLFGYHFFGHTWNVVVVVFATLTITAGTAAQEARRNWVERLYAKQG
jgi:hypothetical protein